MTRPLSTDTPKSPATVTQIPRGETAESLATCRQLMAQMASGDLWPPPAPPNSELTRSIERMRHDLGTVIANIHAQLAELRNETRMLKEELERVATVDQQPAGPSLSTHASKLLGRALLLESREDDILQQLEALRIDRRLTSVNLCDKGLLRFGPGWCIDIEEIDDRHRTIFGHINTIYASLMGRYEATDLILPLETLISVAKAHFAAEEQLMRQQNYPELELQIEAHAGLTDALQRIYDHAKHHDSVDHAAALKLFSRWTREHIRQADARYGDYVHDQSCQAT